MFAKIYVHRDIQIGDGLVRFAAAPRGAFAPLNRVAMQTVAFIDLSKVEEWSYTDHNGGWVNQDAIVLNVENDAEVSDFPTFWDFVLSS